MPTTSEFFSTFLPEKLKSSANLQGEKGVIQFDIGGAGTWSLDLAAGTVADGPHEAPDCKITTDQATWEGILENPSKAMQAFMMGKLKATNVGMAMKLQKILA